MHRDGALQVCVQWLGQVSVVGCPIRLPSGLEGLAWRSVPLGLDTASGSQSLSSYAASLQNRGSRASIYPHARYQDLPGGGVGSCTSLVSFWLRLTRVLGYYSVIFLPVGGRLSRPIRRGEIELSYLAFHIHDADVWQKS